MGIGAKKDIFGEPELVEENEAKTSDAKLRPLQNRLIVERLESKDKTPGGLFIPETAKEKPQQGKVLAVGSGKILENGILLAPEVKVGDIVLFGKYAGQDIKILDKEVFIIKEDDVYGIIEEE